MAERGRPSGYRPMTHRRKRVLEYLASRKAHGEPVTFAEVARRCGLYDYREARTTMRDLERMGYEICEN